MGKVKMEDGTKYMSNETGDVWTLNEDYDGRWYIYRIDEQGGHHKTLSCSTPAMRTMLQLHYSIIEGLSLEEKVKSYDELYSWYLWLKRRTHNGKVNKGHVETFLQGIKKEFEGVDAE
ncbi:hypothetical protein PQE66_gp055 [Bacillus phage PBC2]|uniref:Uncharacterized protein n=1 Tax=Bacillus phage PBC2 TaxID=1675029 RepID=A0A218KBU5_9CAUD|nr:hypothetical protein PQE66_gp055 [Bacillus phage PBC2]AKQ08370.1 hypothetical protein PBC2_055 [Bacillus phage PBC2]